LTHRLHRVARAIPVAAFLALAISAPALAQLYPGDDVQVNSSAIPRPLSHRHGKHVLPPDSAGVIHLHMPRAHHAPRVAKSTAVAAPESTPPAAAAPKPSVVTAAPPPAPAAPRKAVATAAPTPTQTKSASDDLSWGAESPVAQPAPSQPAPAKVRRKAAAAVQPRPVPRRAAAEAATLPAGAPPASSSSGDMPFSFESPGGAQPAAPAAAPARAPVKSTERTPARKQSKVASLGPAPAETPARGKAEKPARAVSHSGQTKQGEILFPAGGTDPDAASYQQMKSLATNVNSALNGGAGGVEVDAFGGTPGDKSSDARRMSLRRALAVRQLLIDNGVPADRISVHALGGIEDQGKPDRVDVYVGAAKSG
jgi:outer membrane protein OmpA-like peptidoglycan-associated protein